MYRAFISKLIVASIVVSVFAGSAFGCACCSEAGTYYLHTGKPSSYDLDVVNQFRFTNAATLFSTEAGYDVIKGLDSYVKESEAAAYTNEELRLTSASLKDRIFRFQLATPKGVRGTLALPLPVQMTQYAVDIHDGSDDGLGPLLYKEFRFKGRVSVATGMLASSATRGTNYSLVFQGRGRACNEASDFKNWRLEVTGPRADYAFYGKLITE